MVTALLKSPAPLDAAPAAPAKMLPFVAVFVISERVHMGESCKFLASFHGHYASLPSTRECYNLENTAVIASHQDTAEKGCRI